MDNTENKLSKENSELDMDWDKLEKALDIIAESKHPEWNEMLDTMENIPLWDKDIPEFNESFKQRKPSISVLPPSGESPRGAVIVCAGGAYHFKSVFEGKAVAERFQAAGFGAAVLDYRVKPYLPTVSFLDARRAIRLLRARASEWNILQNKIAILGFSAGGHLAGMTATKFDYGKQNSPDSIERVSSRPDAAIQCYGSVSVASFPGKDYIMGTNHDKKSKIELSPDKNIRLDSPPFFLWQTAEDKLIDAREMLNMAKELIDYGVPVEMHLFPYGSHGLGLADGSNEGTPNVTHVSQWMNLCINWLIDLGF